MNRITKSLYLVGVRDAQLAPPLIEELPQVVVPTKGFFEHRLDIPLSVTILDFRMVVPKFMHAIHGRMKKSHTKLPQLRSFKKKEVSQLTAERRGRPKAQSTVHIPNRVATGIMVEVIGTVFLVTQNTAPRWKHPKPLIGNPTIKHTLPKGEQNTRRNLVFVFISNIEAGPGILLNLPIVCGPSLAATLNLIHYLTIAVGGKPPSRSTKVTLEKVLDRSELSASQGRLKRSRNPQALRFDNPALLNTFNSSSL